VPHTVIGQPAAEPPTLAALRYAAVGVAAQTSRCSASGCARVAHYRFATRTPDGDLRCRRHALVYRPVCGRAISVALVVGTILVAINQGDVRLSGHLTALVAAKIGLTYMVPFSVSTYSALAANRLPSR